jgi:hypothetical protein
VPFLRGSASRSSHTRGGPPLGGLPTQLPGPMGAAASTSLSDSTRAALDTLSEHAQKELLATFADSLLPAAAPALSDSAVPPTAPVTELTTLSDNLQVLLVKLDHGLIDALRSGQIALVRTSWLTARPADYRIQRRQELAAITESPAPLLTGEEAVELVRSSCRAVGALSYGWCAGCALYVPSSVRTGNSGRSSRAGLQADALTSRPAGRAASDGHQGLAGPHPPTRPLLGLRCHARAQSKQSPSQHHALLPLCVPRPAHHSHGCALCASRGAASLYQNPPGGKRTAEEEIAFKGALSVMGALAGRSHHRSSHMRHQPPCACVHAQALLPHAPHAVAAWVRAQATCTPPPSAPPSSSSKTCRHHPTN